MLGIAWPSKMRGRGCKGGTWADDDMQVGVVGGQGAEIGQILTQKGRYRARLPAATAVAIVTMAAVVAAAAAATLPLLLPLLLLPPLLLP